VATPLGTCEPCSIDMSRSTTRDPDYMVVARFIVSVIDSGGKITLREKVPDLSLVRPPDTIRALHRALNSLILPDGRAIDFILQHAITVPEAGRVSDCSEADILSRIERGDLGGLFIDGVWLVSRRRADELAGLAEAEKWFKAHGYKGFRTP
jgi:hypothetical protein